MREGQKTQWMHADGVGESMSDTCGYRNPPNLLMMMIAFITIKSSLVPLIEGLCARLISQNSHIVSVCVCMCVFVCVSAYLLVRQCQACMCV